MDAALDTEMNYLERTGQAQNFVEVQSAAAMAILADWKTGGAASGQAGRPRNSGWGTEAEPLSEH
jgi:hypothetical protein